MANLEFSCEQGHTWNVLTSIAHDPDDLQRCPECGEPAQAKIGPIADFVYTEVH